MIYGIYVYLIPAQEISMSKQKHDFFSTRKQFCFLRSSQTHGDYHAIDLLNWTSATYSSIAVVQFGLTFSNNRPFNHHIFTIKIPATQTPFLRHVMIEIISTKKIHYELLYLTRKLVTTPNIWETLRRDLEAQFWSPNVAEIPEAEKWHGEAPPYHSSVVSALIELRLQDTPAHKVNPGSIVHFGFCSRLSWH